MKILGDLERGVRLAARLLIGFAALSRLSLAPVEAQTCTGDCNADGAVQINELVVGVNIALDLLPVSSCPSLSQPEPTATPTSNEERTRKPTNTEGPTRTPIPEATDTPGEGGTETPSAAEACAGDCDGGGAGTADSTVSIDELIAAVNNALTGCPAPDPTATATEPPTAEPTETPTQGAADTATATVPVVPTETETPGETDTETPTVEATATATSVEGTATATSVEVTETPTDVPTATATDTPRLESVAGSAALVTNAVAGIPNVIAAIVTGVMAGGGGGGQGTGAGGVDIDPCQLGGTVETIGSLPNATINLIDCEVPRPNGSTLFNGTIILDITNLFQLSGTATMNAQITFKNLMGEATLTTMANVTTAVRLRVRVAGPLDNCDFEVPLLGATVLTGLELTLDGSLGSTMADGTQIVLTFNGTEADLTINSYGPDCVPQQYVLELNGMAEVSYSQGGGGAGVMETFDLLFTDFVVTADADEFTIMGTVTSQCSGGTVILSTVQSLRLLLGEFCPEAGQINVQDIGDIFYDNGGVRVESDGGEPMSHPSCLDPALLACVG